MTGWRDAAGRIPVTLWLVAAMVSAQLAAALSVPLIHRFGSAMTTEVRLLWAAGFLMLVARPRLWGLGGPRLLGGIALGVVTAGMSFFYFAAIGRIPLGTVVSIEFLGPLTVALVGSRHGRDIGWAVLAAFGVWLLTRGAAVGVDLLGYAFAAASAVCWGGYILLTRRVGKVFTGLQGVTLSLSVAAVIGLPIGIVPHLPDLRWTLVILMAFIALLTPVLTYALEMASLRRMEPRRFGILMSLEPATGAVMGFLVLGQRLSLGQLGGMACVMGASLGASLAASPKKKS
ncbi:EamA family transporter [Acidisoma cladoniae]|jgi:inner membrane transporter RhtA|uniref:EamA family transporter n=1 Tax=Acidisoma cladoniae TaxID=3040935 RepID=UPI0025501A25|nr:EamA family transporter [Acidisoma sp. PAMC 29798]